MSVDTATSAHGQGAAPSSRSRSPGVAPRDAGALAGLRAASAWTLARLTFETPWLTLAYWATTLAFALAFWVPRFPQLVDYPQHLAVASVLRRWFDPASPERQLYDVNLFTYNGAFHVLAATLGLAMPMETAGRVVLSLMPFGLATGALAVVQAAGRPRVYAFLFLPLVMNGMIAWGFLNNVLAYGVGLVATAFLVRARRLEIASASATADADADARATAVESARANAFYVVGAALGVVTAATHIFGAFVLSASVGLLALFGFAAIEVPLRVRVSSFAKSCAALVPSALLSLAFVLHNRASEHANWENAVHDGIDEYAWRKLVYLADFLTGNFVDKSDRVTLGVVAALVVFVFLPRPGDGAPDRALVRLGFFYFVLFLVTPRVLFATWFIFERLPVVAALFLIAGAPVLRAPWRRVVDWGAPIAAFATALNVLVHHARIPGEEDASAVLDAIPPNRRVLGVVHGPSPWPVVERASWVHLQAYYLARKPGEIAPTFATIESLPVHYKRDRVPALPGAGDEWHPEAYSTSQPYAPYFDVVFVAAPRDVLDPAETLFEADAPRAKVIAHRGRFWAYDASAIFDGAGGAP